MAEVVEGSSYAVAVAVASSSFEKAAGQGLARMAQVVAGAMAAAAAGSSSAVVGLKP